jgi:uncharacterized radical SAM superfamily Fe-S cluster-containing enzyme
MSAVREKTFSVCPVCLRRIPAERVKEGQNVYLEKSCLEHGFFRTLVWEGPPDFDDWRGCGERESFEPSAFGNCPASCGLCPDHLQRSCCVLLEVTARCNLVCPLCFASAGGEAVSPDPSLAEIADWYDLLRREAGYVNIQLSGGEPTLRDDLPEIIALGRERGFSFFQLNTNGLRLAADPAYAAALKEAGLSCVFLQFDGVTEEPYRAIRGRPLLREKLRVLDHCAEAGLGVVLVPTLVDGINTDQLGGIFALMLERLPAVRGMHIQPAAFFGRYPVSPDRRLTLPKVLRELEAQSGGRVRASDFRGGTAESAHCSFHGSFCLLPDGKITPLSLPGGAGDCGCACGSSGADAVARAQAQVARRWSAVPEPDCCACAGEGEEGSLDAFLRRLRTRSFSISGMAFQDAWSLDLERLRKCYIHVVCPNDKIIPFCAYNLSAVDGTTLYRGVKRPGEEG